MLAVALVLSGRSGSHDTKLAMMGDIATINDIHSAYIHGSIPTAKGESDDIMALNFPDEVLHLRLILWVCTVFGRRKFYM